MDPRRGRGGRSVRSLCGKRWVVLAVLFLLYVLICATILRASRFFPSSKLDYSKYKNLDNISIALLELGLPVSSYALALQQSYVHALRPAISPIAVARLQDDDEYDRFRLGASVSSIRLSVSSRDSESADLSWKMQDNHPLKFKLENITSTGKSSDNSEENVQQGSEISIYSVNSSFSGRQQFWVFHNVCYNGSHMIRLQNESCREPVDSGRNSVLYPIYCQQTELFSIGMASLNETRIPMSERSSSWIASRGYISWRTRPAAVVYLDGSTTNPRKFLRKVNMLLLMNNATIPAFLDRVDSFMLLTHRRVQALLRSLGDGESHSSFHRTYLSTIMSMAQGMTMEMDYPFSNATEENPLCFQKAVVIGTMKRNSWPGGEIVAELVRNQLRQEFGFKIIPRQSTDWPSLLCMFDNDTRGLSSTSEADLMALARKRSLALDVRIANFTAMDFREKFTALESADIVLGFYGTEMIFPAMFSRESSVLIEIIPYKVMNRVHETQALDSGLVYMGYQCQAGDMKDYPGFQTYTPAACMRNTECKQQYLNLTRVELTEGDLQQIQKLLRLSRLITSEVSAQSVALKEGEKVRTSVVLENLIGGRSKCSSFRFRSNTCNRNWVSFTSDVGGPRICCL